MREFCEIFGPICNLLDSWLDHMSPYEDKTAWDYDANLPHSSATQKQLLHYAQLIKTDVYKQYDYGSDKANILRYGSKVVPSLHLDQISKDLPIALFYGKEDDLADEKDVNWLME